MVSTSQVSPWMVVRSSTADDLFVVAAMEIPYEERRPGFSSTGSVYGFVAAGAGSSGRAAAPSAR